MSEQYYFVSNLLDEIESIPPDSIVSRTIHNDDRYKAILFGFAAGQELSEHTASMPAIIYVLAGKMQIMLGNDLQEAKPGTYIQMQANLPHTIKATTPVKMLLVLLKNP